jgi:glycosyltransferase involved in cell wall biosynthesis
MRTLIDLRWMRPGVAGGIENLSRSFLSELLALDPVGHWTALVPSEVTYDFDTRHRENFRVEAFDRPGRVVTALLRGGRSRPGAAPTASARTPPDAVLSLSGYIVPDMFAHRNVLVFHDLQHEYYPEFFAPADLDERRRVFSASLRRADRVIAVSEYTRQTILERFGLPAERVATAHEAADRRFHPDRWYPTDLPRVLAKYGLCGGEYLLFPAHTWRHKNHDGALEALAALRTRTGLRPPLVLTGTPKEGHPGLWEAARRLGLREQIHFLGYCPPGEMPALYRGAAALFYPSLFEGFGIPLIEAMWCRCPIVCSNVTSLPEVAGDAALLADPRSPEALADALARILTDPTVRAELAERGIRRAREFSWRRFTTEVLRSIHEACRTPLEARSPDEAGTNEPAHLPAERAPRRAQARGQPAPHGHAAMSTVKKPRAVRASLRDLPAPPAGRLGWPWTDETPPVGEVQPNGTSWPAISIVTPVHQGAVDLEETIRSVLLQGYPRLEYLIVDDGSLDGSAEVITRYEPWLAQRLTQEHRGLREAVNRGFAHATGDLCAYLTADAILRPGALVTVAREIAPGRGRHVVMGRCQFIDEAGRFIGIEHPSSFVSYERVLATWKGHTIPPPSLFWTREAWLACGPIEAVSEIDYDLCCRLASRYRFHFVDRVLSSYRLPLVPTGSLPGERRGTEATLTISRRHWGSPWRPRYWRLAASLAVFRFDRRGRGLAILRRSREEFHQRRPAQALAHGAGALLLAPDAVCMCIIYPKLRSMSPSILKRRFSLLAQAGETDP